MELRYEAFGPEHFALWDEHLLKNPKVMAHVYSYETGVKKMPIYLAHREKHGFGWYSIFHREEFVGRVGLFWNTSTPPQVELGYTIREEYWGKGIATQASMFALTEFFKLGISDEVVAVIEDENPASIKVAKNLGFKLLDEAEVFIEGNSRPLRTYLFKNSNLSKVAQ
jgi:RimJ/RimL family protein N-acetyltransferase